MTRRELKNGQNLMRTINEHRKGVQEIFHTIVDHALFVRLVR